MVLIVDDNEFRREEIKKEFWFKDIPVMATTKEYGVSYQRPLVTLVMDATEEDCRNYHSSTELTIFYFKRPSFATSFVKYAIVNKDLTVDIEQVIEITKKAHKLDFCEDTFGVLTVDFPRKEFYFGSEIMEISKTQFKILTFLTYHIGKKFSKEELFAYLRLHKELNEDTFADYMFRINHLFYVLNRDFIIENNYDYYQINSVVLEKMRRADIEWRH